MTDSAQRHNADPDAQETPETWGILGSSPAVRRLREEIRIVAALDATVLITGETGTGKGLVASALHRASRRAGAPFVQVDCAALAPSIIESELFGHERGAFTGAHCSRAGRFESAGNGVLFLDEIGEIAAPLQAKLLRVLQDRLYERVGTSKPRRFQARVVAATHCDLQAAVTAREFRADLYYRLNVVRLEITPLRERLSDLPELVAQRLGRPPSAALLAELRRQRWPGNIRELHNWLERRAVEERLHRVAFARIPDGFSVCANTDRSGDVRPSIPLDLPGSWHLHDGRASARRLEQTLREAGGNVSRAARRLGVARSTLRRRIARYGLASLIPRD
jgi:transcriptional regulator with GAF, ATPase, and Fis domain